jgi:hypothetical protein
MGLGHQSPILEAPGLPVDPDPSLRSLNHGHKPQGRTCAEHIIQEFSRIESSDIGEIWLEVA